LRWWGRVWNAGHEKFTTFRVIRESVDARLGEEPAIAPLGFQVRHHSRAGEPAFCRRQWQLNKRCGLLNFGAALDLGDE
jgi:hypothetical protein